MSYSSRAHEAGGWDKIPAAPAPYRGLVCDKCDEPTMTTTRHGELMLCPACKAATDQSLESLGQQQLFAPECWDEEAAA